MRCFSSFLLEYIYTNKNKKSRKSTSTWVIQVRLLHKDGMADEADRGCYLTFAEENNGCLYLNWSEKPVEGVSFSDELD